MAQHINLVAEIKKIRGHVNRLRYAVDANCIVTVRNACECLESSIDLLVNSINTLEVKEFIDTKTLEVKEVDTELNSFDATVCKIGSTFLKEMDASAIAKALESYKDGDKVKVTIKALKGE